MEREQARRLWLRTLGLRAVGADEASRRQLEAIWEAVGLSHEQRGRLWAAVQSAPDTASVLRREALVRATRRLIAEAGYAVDLLTTPAAEGQAG